MPADTRSLMHLEVPLIVQLGVHRMSLKEVMSLAPGSIVELPKPADEELEILVNNKVIGQGTAVRVGDNFGIRITGVGDRRQRLEAVEDGAAAG